MAKIFGVIFGFLGALFLFFYATNWAEKSGHPIISGLFSVAAIALILAGVIGGMAKLDEQ